MNFAEKMAELEKILKEMEGDALPLDSALNEYERGVKLIRECRSYLAEAQQKITMLSQEEENDVGKGSADE
ncbi:exodeoxyribonuclease VII small subunit [Synergistes jonesii]|uniref:exodeoxyribonuclease VII small subunit n=1 Tax=Synergistes jonesii TaxID=2754 RepID=UPI003322DD51